MPMKGSRHKRFWSGRGTDSINREVVSSQGLEIQQVVRRTGSHHLAVLHDVTEIRDSEGRVRILLDHEDRQSAFPQFVNLLENLGDEFRGESQARFVQHQDRGFRHKGAPNPDHLLLTPTETTGLYAGPFLQAGEQFVYVLQGRIRSLPSSSRVGTETEVRLRRQERKQSTPLGARRDPEGRAVVRGKGGDVLPLENDVTGGRSNKTVDHFQDRRLAGSVRADDDGDGTFRNRQRDAREDLDRTVAGVDVVKLEHGPPPSRGRLQPPRGHGPLLAAPLPRLSVPPR